MEKQAEKLTILHFNDVYNLEEGKNEPVGGVARFKTALDSFKDLEPLIIFSGDLFQPSLLGTLYNGEQMIKPAIEFNIDVACFGNHEFDVELDTLTDYIKRTNIPWLLSNVKDVHTKLPVAGGKEYHIQHKHGYKIGYVGLAEEDWLHLVNAIDEDDIIFEGYVECAQRLTKLLREEHKCDLVIALTHMRTHNDVKLAQAFHDFDLILGGHDHVNTVTKVSGTYVIKSGSDFREFNKITMTVHPEGVAPSPRPSETLSGFKAAAEVKHTNYSINYNKRKIGIDYETIYVTKEFEPNPVLKAHTDYYLELFQQGMDLPLGISLCELETRFDKIRNSEQNLANFVADLIRLETESDVALLNTGTIRSNLLFERGLLKMGDIRLMFPYADLIMQLELTGKQLLTALENGVSKYPALEGRFPALSGVSFAFDPNREPMNRIALDTLRVRGAPLELDHKYTLATKLWILGGKDGYEVFTEAKLLTDESVAEELHSTIKKFFELVKDKNFTDLYKAEQKGEASPGKLNKKKTIFVDRLKELVSDVVEFEGQEYIAINPKVEGRIRIL